MNYRRLYTCLALLGCLALLAACGRRQAAPRGGATDFTLRMLDGSTVQLSKLVGQPVVVHFWGSW